MHVVGIDIGSTSTKIVAIDSMQKILANSIVTKPPGTTGEKEAIEELYEDDDLCLEDCAGIIATGYGRLISQKAHKQFSEISCHAKGVHKLVPDVRTIVDVGGQDLKVIKVDKNGVIQQFLLNDKCAAGTGRFLEMMSMVLGIDINELGDIDKKATKAITISNTCTVFAESEVISLMSAGHEIANIVAGIHDSVARKIEGLVMRVGVEPQVVMTGGGALNSGLTKALSTALKETILVPKNPQFTGALGAALYAWEAYLKNSDYERR